MASAESIVTAALKSFVPNADGTFRVYPDVAPAGVVKPYITYQDVGGEDATTLSGENEQQNARMQMNVWATTRAEAVALMRQVQTALTAAPILGTPIGTAVSVYEADTKLRGRRLDFSIWYTP